MAELGKSSTGFSTRESGFGIRDSQTPNPRPPTPVLLKSPPPDLASRIEYRRRLVADGRYTVLGKLLTIVFDPRGMSPRAADRPVSSPNMLQWFDEPYKRDPVTGRMRPTEHGEDAPW